MKILNKKIVSMLIIFLIIIGLSVSSFAWSIGDFDPSGTSVSGTDEIKDFGNDIVGIITTIGIVSSVIVLIIIGIKYMMGSVEEKAQYKKSLMPYVIGAGLVFMTSSIANFIYNWALDL